MNLKQLTALLSQSTGKQRGDALLSIACTLAGGLLPLWGGLFIFLVVEAPVRFLDRFVSHGEFALYAAGLLSNSIYLTVRIWIMNRLLFGWVLLAIVVLLVMCTIMFVLTVLSATDVGAVKVNISWIAWCSLFVFASSLLVNGLYTLFNNVIDGLDPAEAEGAMQKTLNDAFDRLEVPNGQ